MERNVDDFDDTSRGFLLTDTERSFGLVSILFHWCLAALFLAQFWIGLTMESEQDLATKAWLLATHVSLGFVILFLWIARAVWKLFSKRPALPARMEGGERVAAKASHWLLFWLLGLTPFVGWAIVSAVRGPLPLPISVFGLFSMPHLLGLVSPNASGLLTSLHAFLAYFLLILSGVHALAAIRHQFTLKDGLLARMIVPGRRLTDR
jgi:cytochrome b561